MKGDKNSANLTGFQRAHQRRQSRRIYREYRDKHRPRLFKIAVLALIVFLFILALLIFSMRGSINITPKSTAANDTSKLPTPAVIDNLQGQKLVALTFDDGPGPDTETLLNILKKEQVTATFFVLGMRANRYRDIVQQEYQAGNQVASHTTNHKNLTILSPAARQAEIDYTATLIEQTTGARPTVVRPPYGAWNGDVLRDTNAPLLLWSIDPRDWEYHDADQIYQGVMSQVRDGSIVLLHDIYPASIQAVAKIIPALKAEGYAVVTVNRLMLARGASFAPGYYYRYLYP